MQTSVLLNTSDFSMKPKSKLVAIVDDDETMRSLLSLVVDKSGFKSVPFASISEFQNGYREDFSLILMDLILGDEDAIELMKFLSEKGYPGPIVVISASEDSILESARQLALARGLDVRGVLRKPFSVNDITEKLVLWTSPSTKIQPVLEKNFVDVDTLREALIDGNIVPFFQPKIDLSTGRISGVEALVRLKLPDDTLVSPDAFIPLAEKSGLISLLTESVLTETLRQCSEWNSNEIRISVAVNISARSLVDPVFPEKVFKLLKDYSVDPSQLILEVTESTISEDSLVFLEILTRLRMRGVRLSIDDFGTGHSNLNELKNLPFSEIKIDKSFISDCLEDSKSMNILLATVDLAKKLGLKTVAEGVENGQQLELLREIGCDEAQGFLFSRPVDAMNVFAISSVLHPLRNSEPPQARRSGFKLVEVVQND